MKAKRIGDVQSRHLSVEGVEEVTLMIVDLLLIIIIDINRYYSHPFEKMEIKLCPTLYPNHQEFNNFDQYIHFLEQTYKPLFGMVKVVPPAGWKPQSSNYQNILQKLTVKNAIQQNVQGRGGYYESKNIIQKKMPYKAYRRYSEKESAKIRDLPYEEKQKLFWKTITYSPPVYGADLTGSLMDQTAGAWNLNSLNSILRHAIPNKVKGVTEPYCYIGTWKAFFSWHKQDLDLSAINYIHQGESKIWYSIAAEDSYILQDCAKQHYRTQYLQCPQFLRHKTFLIQPQILLKKYPEVKISKAVHQAGQIMLVFGGAYHQGFNCGFNIAEAVNYATLSWLNDLLTARSCSCSRKSVKSSIQAILYNLEESEIFEELLKNQSFQKIRNHVQLKIEQEQALQNNIHSLSQKQEKQNVNKQQQLISTLKTDDTRKGHNSKTKQIKKKAPKKKSSKNKVKHQKSTKKDSIDEISEAVENKVDELLMLGQEKGDA